LVKIFLPFGLAPSHVFQGSPTAVSYAVLIGFSFAVAVAVYGSRRSRAFLFGLLAFAVCLAPTLIAVRPGAVPLYDHHLYMPLCLLTAMAAFAVAQGKPRLRWPAAALVLALGLGSTVQAGYWKDSESLWGRVLAVYPESQTARYNLALSRGSQGRWLDALLAVDAQLAIFPADEAAADFREILLNRAAPAKDARARLLSDAASARFEAGDAAGAAATLQEARALAPREPMILVNSAIAAAALGKRAEARLYLRRALAAEPGNARAKEALAALEAAR
jgi:tetratricopeptide (TPR) repeat protein